MILKFIPAVILATLSMACAIASIPVRGGVNANTILLLPASGFFVLAILAAITAAVL